MREKSKRALAHLVIKVAKKDNSTDSEADYGNVINKRHIYRKMFNLK